MAELNALVTTAILGILGGIYIGRHFSLPEGNCSDPDYKEIKDKHNKKIDIKLFKEEEEDDDDDDDDDDVGVTVDSNRLNDIEGEVRMALIVRSDLGMLKGKVAAQCSHAAVSCYRQMNDSKNKEGFNPTMLKRWERGGQAKIALKCASLEEIEELLMKAVSLNINNYLVVDAGRTQIAPGSATVLGLGPAPKSVLDLVTGELKLY